jgi:hypothetical protein
MNADKHLVFNLRSSVFIGGPIPMSASVKKSLHGSNSTSILRNLMKGSPTSRHIPLCDLVSCFWS